MTRTDHQRTADRAWAKATGNAEALGQWQEFDLLNGILSDLREAQGKAQSDLGTARVRLASTCSGKDTAKAITAAAASVRAAEDSLTDAKHALDVFAAGASISQTGGGAWVLASKAVSDGVQRRAGAVASWGAQMAEKVNAARLLGQPVPSEAADLTPEVLAYLVAQDDARLAGVRSRLASTERTIAMRATSISTFEERGQYEAGKREAQRLRGILAADPRAAAV